MKLRLSFPSQRDTIYTKWRCTDDYKPGGKGVMRTKNFPEKAASIAKS